MSAEEKMTALTTFLLAGLFLAKDCLGETGPMVETSLGKVQGYMSVSRGGKNFKAYAGIPYAKPPVGPLRFQPPEPAEPWTDLRQAKEHGPMCPQINIYAGGEPVGNEDCLYLSVFTPEKEGKYPVAVHLHGGGWIMGEGPRMKGPHFLMDEDIVVVDFNYRIGILGFLSFEDDLFPGNMGLKDMAMLLQWVKKNIANFGGDPERVTVVGECAGAEAVYHIMVSPMTKGLVSGGIAESGSSYTAPALAPPGLARQRAEMVAGLFGCGVTVQEMVECLRGKDALDIISLLPKFMTWQIDPVFSFGPVLEPHAAEPFLTAPMSSWQPANLPLLTGITSGEGLLRTMFLTKGDAHFSKLESDFNNLMKATLMLHETSSEPDKIMGKLRDFYFPTGGNSISPVENFKNLTDMIGDNWFAVGVLEAAMHHPAPVFVYYFDYVGEHTISEFFGNKSFTSGAFHTDEALYLWEMGGMPPYKGRDLEMSKDLVKIWTAFIKDGKPSVDGVTKDWQPYMPGEKYMDITKGGFQMKENLISDRYQFWKSLNHRDKYM